MSNFSEDGAIPSVPDVGLLVFPAADEEVVEPAPKVVGGAVELENEVLSLMAP